MSEDDYKVGYKKPPTHSRFKSGKSGNPKGRPKGSRNFGTILKQRLKQRVTIVEKGRRKTITMEELIIRKLLNDAVAGDVHARRDVFRLAAEQKDAKGGIQIVYLDEVDMNM